MNKRKFKYPQYMSVTKNIAKLMVVLLIVFTIYILITAKPLDYDTVFEYLVALVSPIVMGVFIFWFIYAWSDISVDQTGLFVEFLWFDLYVPWDDIVSLQYIGSKSFGVWLLQTKNNRLTPFHKSYSFIKKLSLRPGLFIYTRSKAHNDLIKTIEKNITP
jgi:hypothetical protein